MKIRGSARLQTVMAMYDQEMDRDRAMPTHEELKTMVRRPIRMRSVASHFVYERARCFSRSRALLVLPCPSVYNPVLCGTNVPISPAPDSSSNMGSPNGSLPDLEGTRFRTCTMEEKINEIIVSRRLLRQWPPRRLRLQILNRL